MEYNPPIEITTEDRHRFFLLEAYEFGYANADEHVTRVGAILVRQFPDCYRMLVGGANHIPRSIDVSPRELIELLKDREWKYNHTVHAERSAIERARQLKIRAEGTTMYMPWVPCMNCAEEWILKSGIAELVGHKQMIQRTPERWWESTTKAIERLKSEGVSMLMYDGQINEAVSLMNGEVWFP